MTRVRDISISALLNTLVFMAIAMTMNNAAPSIEHKAIKIDFIPLDRPGKAAEAPSLEKAAPPAPVKKDRKAPTIKTFEAKKIAVKPPVEQVTAPSAEPAPLETAEEKIVPDDAAAEAVSAMSTSSAAGAGFDEEAAQEAPPPSAPSTAVVKQDSAPGSDGGYIAAETLTTPPGFLVRQAAVYPVMARHAGKEGEVIIEVWLEPDGSVAMAKVTQKAGWGFDEAALEAARSSVFSPGRIDGKPVRTKARVPYKFVLR